MVTPDVAPTNPVEAYLCKAAMPRGPKLSFELPHPEKFGAGKARQDYEAWLKWHHDGRTPTGMRPLVRRFRGAIEGQVRVYSGIVPIPPAAIRANFHNSFADAMGSYNPNKGAALATWAIGSMRKSKRMVQKYQNIARIPTNRIEKIRQFEDAQEHLLDLHGRDPTMHELSGHLNWSVPEVTRMGTELSHKAMPSSAFGAFDPVSFKPSRWDEIERLLPYELSAKETRVFEHLHGIGGKEQLQPGAIATKLSMSSSEVSRIKKGIADKILKYQK